jgi:hypothetical protein
MIFQEGVSAEARCSKSLSVGHEDLLPDCGSALHPLPHLPGGQSLFRTQEHALLR